MRLLRIVGPLVVALTLVGCAADETATKTPTKTPEKPSTAPTAITMPDLVGQKLDVAYGKLADVGLDDKDEIEVEGGGTFGVVVESNWTVCEQSPAAGGDVSGKPSLTVERN